MATMMDIFIHTAMKQMHTTRTHTHTLYWKSLTFPAHTCTLFLFCSALHGLGLLSGAITSSTGGEGPLILLPLFATLSTLLPLAGEQGDESSTGRNRTSHHLLRASARSHTCKCSNTHTHTKGKKKKNTLKFQVMEAFVARKEIRQCFIIIGDKPSQVSHKRDKQGSAAKQLGYCL